MKRMSTGTYFGRDVTRTRLELSEYRCPGCTGRLTVWQVRNLPDLEYHVCCGPAGPIRDYSKAFRT